jgi:hypothetical protein
MDIGTYSIEEATSDYYEHDESLRKNLLVYDARYSLDADNSEYSFEIVLAKGGANTNLLKPYVVKPEGIL